jgi:hypothetical protein
MRLGHAQIGDDQCGKPDQELEGKESVAREQMRVGGTEDGDPESYVVHSLSHARESLKRSPNQKGRIQPSIGSQRCWRYPSSTICFQVGYRLALAGACRGSVHSRTSTVEP